MIYRGRANFQLMTVGLRSRILRQMVTGTVVGCLALNNVSVFASLPSCPCADGTVFDVQALAPRGTEFNRAEGAPAWFCRLSTGHLRVVPAEAQALQDYLHNNVSNVQRYMSHIHDQVLALNTHALEHVSDVKEDLAKNIVMGPGGLWIHSHFNQSSNGTLIQVRRNESGQWEPVQVFIEWAYRPRHDRPPPCFFSVNSLTHSHVRQEAILESTKPLVSLYQEVLERIWNQDPETSITLMMGHGVTPGTEGAWVINPIQDWDSQTGFWMDPTTGWTFLAANRIQNGFTPADEAAFMLRTWQSRMDAKFNVFIGQPLPARQTHIDSENLAALIPWIASFQYIGLTYRKNAFSIRTYKFITPEEIAYVIFLARQPRPPFLPASFNLRRYWRQGKAAA